MNEIGYTFFLFKCDPSYNVKVITHLVYLASKLSPKV